MNITKTARAISLVMFGLGLAVNGYSQSFLTNGLVAYYPFNGNANDESGNGNTGVNHGDPQPCIDRFGTPNGAYQLNGAGDWISAAGSSTLNITNDFTISLWVNPSTAASGMISVLVCYSQEDIDQYAFDFWPWGCIYFTYSNNGYNDITDCSGYVWSYDVWHHACVVVRRASNKVDFFRNGILLSSVVVDFAAKPILPVQDAQLQIGINPGENQCFPGMLDDIRIYNRAFSDIEVGRLYFIESGKTDPRVDLIKAVRPSFSPLLLGTNYQLQVASDLHAWTNYGAPFTATNSSMAYPQYFDVGTWGKLFFRLH